MKGGDKDSLVVIMKTGDHLRGSSNFSSNIEQFSVAHNDRYSGAGESFKGGIL
jgi:hypothetical protein